MNTKNMNQMMQPGPGQNPVIALIALGFGWVVAVCNWLATFFGWAVEHHLAILSVVGSIAAIWASIWAGRSFRANTKAREQEFWLLQDNTARAESDLCAMCQLGQPPSVCPIPPERRPANCPKRKEKVCDSDG